MYVLDMTKSWRFLTLFLVFPISLVSTVSAAQHDPGLPNPNTTPGVTNPLVTQSNIQSTICVSGYTKTIRPSSYYTNKIKYSQLSSGYGYKGDKNPADYEEDHLVPLEVGGDPMSVKNLFPQPWHITWNAGRKDRLENKIHSLVCTGAMTLPTAQKMFMSNWIIGYQKFIGK